MAAFSTYNRNETLFYMERFSM